ncbi:MAG: DUF3575 domain-containing protein [Chitinophagaceae bacterium]|nr:MAG: DUF3575 domain-containing protein [Chitinophagaceae bacterium]
MRIFVAVIMLISFMSALKAQKFPDSLSATTAFARLNPLGLVDISDMNLSVGAEKRFSNRSSVALDVAYIFFSQRFHDRGRTSGVMLRPAYRFFPGKKYFFLETELQYKLVTHRYTDWVGKDVENGVASYEEYMNFRLRKQVLGVHLKAGRQFNLSDKLWLEIYLGVGVHFRKYRIANHRDWRYVVDDNFSIDPVVTGETDVVAALPAGLRFLYRLSK